MIKYIAVLVGSIVVFLAIAAVVGRQPCHVTFVGTYANFSQSCECVGKEIPVEITEKNKKLGGVVIGGELDDMPVETKELTMCYGFISSKVLRY